MTPWVTRLIVANIVMFFVEFTMPRLASALVFVPSLVFTRPWSVLTYMFLHDPNRLTHILFNMLGLYFFGPRVEERLGSKRFIWMYVLSGLSGAVLSMIFAPRAAILGASAAVFGVMMAFAYYWPRVQIYIWGILPVEARLLVVITTVLALYSGFGGSRGGVADFAHLGGYVGAYLYLKWMERTSGTRAFKAQSLPKVVDRSLANWQKIDPRSAHEVNRDELNRILDKIGKSGLASLTAPERVFLSNFVPPDDRIPPPT